VLKEVSVFYKECTKMREAQIQTSIKKKLEKSGWLVIKLIQTSWNGIPDQLILKDGRTLFIEVKQPGQQPSALQAIRHRQLREMGFEVITATSTKDIQHLCN
jgi:hypothetical protein